MLVLVILAAAVGLLVHGLVVESSTEVMAAGGLSLLVLAVVVGSRWWSARPDAERDTPIRPPAALYVTEESADEGAPSLAAPEHVGRVVFVAGRTTFHAPTCAAVEGRPVSSADRADLEAGGMSACRRCLPVG